MRHAQEGGAHRAAFGAVVAGDQIPLILGPRVRGNLAGRRVADEEGNLQLAAVQKLLVKGTRVSLLLQGKLLGLNLHQATASVRIMADFDADTSKPAIVTSFVR